MIGAQQLCTFRLDDQLFGIEASLVQEVIRYQEMTRVPLAPPSVRGLINLRGQIVTAIDLRTRLGFPQRSSDALPMNVVVRSEEGAVSLLVDQIGDVVEVDTQHFEKPPATLQSESRRLTKGAFKMDDNLLLLLDTVSTIQINSEQL